MAVNATPAPPERRFLTLHESNRYMFEHIEDGADVTINVFKVSRPTAPAPAPTPTPAEPKAGEPKTDSGTPSQAAPTPVTTSGGERVSLGSSPAHMYILRCRCPALADTARNSGGRFEIDVENITLTALKEVLRHLYYEKANLGSGNVFDVLQFSKKYDIDVLRKVCINFIRQNTNAKTVCEILEQSLEFDDKNLTETCTEFISQNTKAVLQDPSFLKATDRVVDVIASQDYLGVTELELFKRCVDWARQPPANGALKGKELREKLGMAMANDKFRFPTMSLIDFNQNVVPLDILTSDETVEIYNYLANPNHSKPPTRYVTTKRHTMRKTGGSKQYQGSMKPNRERTNQIDLRADTPPL